MPWRALAGRGLGRAIVDRLAKLIGGAIAVESAPGRESRSSLDQPAEPAAGAAMQGGVEFTPARFGQLSEEIGSGQACALVEVFLGDAAEHVAAMRKLAATGERKTLARMAHSIKSSAATFGFERIAAFAREIESVAAEAPQPRLLALAEAAAEALDGGREAWHLAARETA